MSAEYFAQKVGDLTCLCSAESGKKTGSNTKTKPFEGNNVTLHTKKKTSSKIFARAHRRRVQNLRAESKKRCGYSPGKKIGVLNVNQPVPSCTGNNQPRNQPKNVDRDLDPI